MIQLDIREFSKIINQVPLLLSPETKEEIESWN